MNKVKHVKDPRCWEENEDYYLNRRIVKAHTKDKVYYYQRVDGIIVNTKQYRISRLIKELDEIVGKELLNDGERTETDIEVEYIYNRYRKTGNLENFEEVLFEDFLSNLLDWEEARLLKWFYSEKELYRDGIKFLIRYKYEDYVERNIYRDLFKLKDLQVRGYFMSEMTELPLKYQWLFIYLEQEIEKRAERFEQPKEKRHEEFIRLLLKISKKAQMSPQQYFETKFLPFYNERMTKKRIEFASKELGVHFVKENDSRSIENQIERVISKLPAKERKQWLKRRDK